MPRNEMEESEGFAAWVRRWWRALAAEVVSTALLVLLGVGSLVTARPTAVPLTHPAFGFGLIVLINVQAFGAVSGAHMNPAVTLAALLCGKIGAAPAAAYVAAQAAGALLGFGALLGVAPAWVREQALGCTVPPQEVGALAAAAVEALLTGSLALLCCGLWAAEDPRAPDHTVPLKFGLGVAGLVYAGGAMSGASLNPARSLAPALLLGVWTHHWVYWVGPLGGAAAAALLHRHVLQPPRAPPAAPEQLPLADKPAP